jgi:ABC-type multidrug transport system fused ATPase/permease subunit
VSRQEERLHALERSIQRLQRRLIYLRQRSDRYSWIRLAIFLLGIALSILLFFLTGWLWGLLMGVITIVAFSIAVYYHRRIEHSITRHNIWLSIKSTQVARIQLDWEHIPATLAREQLITAHPFETDLDLTGIHSLHQLVNTAISFEGSQRVRDWLLHTSPQLDVIRQRQTLVQELAPLSRFRDKLTMKSLLAARNAAEHLEAKRLLSWLDRHKEHRSMIGTLLISSTLSLLTIVLIVLNSVGVVPPGYWIIALLASLGWFMARREERGDLFEDAYFLRDAFAQLSTVFAYLETYPYGRHEQLKKLCSPFFVDRTQRPSTLLKQISRLASAATLEKNQFLWLIVNALIPWDIYVARQLNRYKALIATLLPTWLETWFELEALCSLANFAYLNPAYILPAVAPVTTTIGTTDGKLFCAQGLGHPLIVEEKRVVNDFALNKSGEIVIITGSNMSGKSTFLRTLGINLCLAYAGGPVNALSFQASLFKLYTCIKVSDSVTDGYSYFYAEVKRLKGLLDELERDELPLFFLIDEIFKGTNNRERLIGSRAYIKALVGQNCLGAISTHDLELVKIADELSGIHNYHFREEVVDGQMVFDYKLRSGPCPTTNALKIMQMEGLPV